MGRCLEGHYSSPCRLYPCKNPTHWRNNDLLDNNTKTISFRSELQPQFSPRLTVGHASCEDGCNANRSSTFKLRCRVPRSFHQNECMLCFNWRILSMSYFFTGNVTLYAISTTCTAYESKQDLPQYGKDLYCNTECLLNIVQDSINNSIH
jgi:hypothetical protein